MNLFTKAFWLAATERALKTAAQSVLLSLGAGVAAGAAGETQVNAFLIDYPVLGGFFLGGALLSYLSSVVSAPIGGAGPSLISSETTAPAATR